jgi:hypothetical protein
MYIHYSFKTDEINAIQVQFCISLDCFMLQVVDFDMVTVRQDDRSVSTEVFSSFGFATFD